MYTGGPCDLNTRQCRKTTQQTFPVSFLHGLYLTCTREDPATVTPASVAKQNNKLFLCILCMGHTSYVHWKTPQPETVSVAKQPNKPFLCIFCMGHTVIPHMYTGRPHDRNTCQCRKTTQQTFSVYFLPGLYLTCTREDPTTVTPARVAKKRNKSFLCSFCMGYTSHVHGRTPRP